MALQAQNLDIRWDIRLLKVGKVSHGYDVIGLGIPVGHTNAARSATVAVAEEGEGLGVHAAWASTFPKLKVDLPVPKRRGFSSMSKSRRTVNLDRR